LKEAQYIEKLFQLNKIKGDRLWTKLNMSRYCVDNIGGKNIIKTDELKRIFEEMGFSDLRTYIQSRNVIFKDTEKDKSNLIEKIEKKLFATLNNHRLKAVGFLSG
jgi:hypothetical protein